MNVPVDFIELRKDRSLFSVCPLDLLLFLTHLALDALKLFLFSSRVVGTVGMGSMTNEKKKQQDKNADAWIAHTPSRDLVIKLTGHLA
jgi:hypothetical protein